MEIWDTHCHLADVSYPDPGRIVERARAAGVAGIVVPGCDLKSNEVALGLGKRFPGYVWPCLGLHPEYRLADAESQEIRDQIRRNRDALVAVGEVGLPYYSLQEGPLDAGEQAACEERLKRCLALAMELDRAVILHAPHAAAARALQLLQDFRIERAVFHWHKATPEITAAIVDAGYLISLTPEVCHRDRDRELAASVSLMSLVVETDGPWRYTGEFEGRPAEPAILPRVIEEIALIKGLDADTVAVATSENARQLFRIAT